MAYIKKMNIQLQQFFQLLSDATRLRCLLLMHQEGELCVCELIHALTISQPKISRHLAALRDAGLVIERRQGKWIYYRLHPELPDWVCKIMNITVAEAINQKPFIKDRSTLSSMPDRPAVTCCD